MLHSGALLIIHAIPGDSLDLGPDIAGRQEGLSASWRVGRIPKDTARQVRLIAADVLSPGRWGLHHCVTRTCQSSGPDVAMGLIHG